jgi:galactose mutarotase-like enzyme
VDQPIEQLTFGGDDLDVVVLPDLGARIHSIRYRGHDLLRTPATLAEHRADPFFWGAYVMAPWCNRIATGLTTVGERVVDLPSNFTDGSAIHGQVYIAPWEREGDELYFVGGSEGWPWRYRTSLRVTVDGSTVRIEQSLQNMDQAPMPGGVGIHPWFAGQPLVAIHSGRVFSTNSNTPAKPADVAGELDLELLGPMAVGVDAAWPVEANGLVAELHWPETGTHIEVHVASDVAAFVVAANPGNRDAIALETQTHAPQGLRRLTNRELGALTMIAPDASLRLVTELRLSQR